MRTDDVASLLVLPPADGIGFRQGVVVEWDRQTAQNRVQVGGSLMQDLPILNTNEALSLAPGSVVGILTCGSTWFILGRITIPGSVEAASALSAVFAQIRVATNNEAGTRNDATYGDLSGTSVGPEVTVTISPAGRALVFWTADYGQSSDWRPIATGGVSVAVSGATTRAADAAWSLGSFLQHPVAPNPGAALMAGGHQGAMMYLFEDLTPGSNTFTLKYRTRSTPGNVEFQSRQIAVLAM
ncbi:hypothetical protein AB0M35_18025 [Micromonospora sp. NPDC051196]|uniref:hypothetical protein n=1 Tax=Micromonospora sp. NPDC051196 TaxID=3155281 RepID=UPI00341DB73A